MPDDRYRLQLGQFELLIIRDRTQQVSAASLFEPVDDMTLEAALRRRGEDPEALELSVNCLAVYTNDDWVLIDTGTGAENDPPGKLARILDDEEIRPEHIILTHGHSDHFNGLLGENGAEQFPNVPVYMCQDEWAVITSQSYEMAHSEAAEAINRVLLATQNQIERVECWGEILPEFSILPLPGHTEHHIGIVVESQGQRLVIAADAAIHPLHLEHLEWGFGNDEDPEKARESRAKLAEYAIEYDALVLFYHFPFPGLGKITRDGDGYRWQPINA